MAINLNSPTELQSAVIIADTISVNGLTNYFPPMTKINGVTVSAALEIQSSLGSLLMPRMTTAERDALVGCPGMFVFNTTTGTLNMCDNTSTWADFSGAGTVTSVDVAESGSGITFTGGPITGSGTITGTLSTNLQNLSDLVTQGLMVKTGSAYTTRAIATANAANITVSNSTGVVGDPTLDLADTGVIPGTYTQANIICDAKGRILTIASGGGSAGAPADATYWVGTSNAFLTNEIVLGSLATGILKNTTTTGIPTIAVAGTDYYSLDNPTRLLDDGIANGNLFVGKNAGNLTYTSAQFNTGLGINSMNAISTGVENSFGGYGSGILLTSGNFNVGFGSRSLGSITNNDACTALGYNAANAFATGSGIVAIGESAMDACTSGTNIIAIGRDSVVANGLTNAIALGYNTTVSASNSMNIGNGVKVGINNPTPAYALDIQNVSGVCAIGLDDTSGAPATPADGVALYSSEDKLFYKDVNGAVVPLNSITQYVVSSDGSTPYSTIQSAITAALAATPSATKNVTVYIKGGTYTENLALSPFVNLVGDRSFYTSTIAVPTIISGVHTLSTGTSNVFKFANISFTSNSGSSSTFTITGSNTTANLIFDNCKVSNLNVSTSVFNIAFSTTLLIATFNDSYISAISKYFDSSGTLTSFTTNLNSSTLTAGSPQTVAATAVNYLINARNSVVTMDINNTSGEGIAITGYYSTFSTAFTNPAGTVQGDFYSCNFTNLSFSGTYTGGSTFAFNFLQCSFGNGSSAFTTFPAGVRVRLNDCSDFTSSGSFKRDKLFFQYSLAEKYMHQESLTTSNATPTVIYSIPIPASMSAWVNINVIGTNSAHTDTTGGNISAIIQCTAAAMNIVNQVRNIGSSSTGDVTLVTNFGAGTLDVTVTGLSATTYYWVSTVEWQKVSTSD